MDDSTKTIKSSLWYIVCNFIVSGIHILTTPIFARMLSMEEYGLYSNYSSWLSIFQIITSLMLLVSLYNATMDFSNEQQDNYIVSMLALSGLFTTVIFVFIYFGRDFFEGVFGIQKIYFPVIYLFLLSNPITNFYQLRQRLNYKYKTSVLISLLIASTSLIGAITLVFVCNNKLFGRIYGSIIPNIIINFSVLFFILNKNIRISKSYWKYALPISVPYMFHSLGMNILSSSDRIMITYICGEADNSLYSLAYSCAMLISILVSAISSAIDPWLLEEFNKKGKKAKSVTRYLALGMFFICVGVILFAPEVILIIGGDKYIAALNVMPPVIAGLFFQFLYSLYSNIEQFSKKTLGMAIATAVAAISNLVLNYLLLPHFGYIAAAYTTLFCYVLLFVIHYFIVKHYGYSWMFDGRTNFFLGGILILFSSFIACIYNVQWIRITACIVYTIIALYYAIIYRKVILEIAKKSLKK